MLRQLSFQFTPLYERRLRFQYTPSLQKVFQFTPLHERQPIRATAHFGCMVISIHASAWEATVTATVTDSRGWKFQFTPLHERRHRFQYTPSLQKVFQFTPLHERRPLPWSVKQPFVLFQFTPLHERQLPLIVVVTFSGVFQFTPLHERQLVCWKDKNISCNFNSRLYMRGNSCSFGGCQTGYISIHASTWEAAVVIETFECEYIFQFMPLHERQPFSLLDHQCSMLSISIHASTWEATEKHFPFLRDCLFQFTPLHERQLTARSVTAKITHFNSRLCMRGNFLILSFIRLDDISIHASAWEATPSF